MRFRDYCELRDSMGGEIVESGLWPSVRAGVLAGVAAAGLMSPASAEDDRVVDTNPTARVEPTVPWGIRDKPSHKTRARWEMAKDRGTYYTAHTVKRLQKLAREGDEWAIRELPWPEGHRFHERGRPFFRNTAAHPDGLKFHSGYEGDSGSDQQPDSVPGA